MAVGPLYTAGLVARTDQRPMDVLNDLATAMGGRVAIVGNQVRFKAGAYEASVMALGDDDFAGGQSSLQVRQPRENTFNVVTGKLIDSDQGWKPDVDFPRVVADAYVEADGGIELPIAVQFNAVNRSSQAQQLSAVMLRYERQALTFVASFKLTAFAAELFDTIALTCSRYGWVDKEFVVMGRKWSLDGLIELTLRETDPTIYSFGDTFDASDVAPNTNLPLPFTVQQLVDLTVSSGTAELTDGSIVTRVRVSWPQATDQAVLQNGKVEIQWLPANTAFPPADWPGTTEQGGATETTITGLIGGWAYHVRGRYIGASGRIRGAWSQQVLHVVAAPPRVGNGGANLFINGSFEVDTSNLADRWTQYTNGTTGTVSNSDATGIFGARAQRIDASNLGTASTDRAAYVQGVNLIGLAETDLTASIYAFGTPGVTLRIQANWYSASGGTLIDSSIITFGLTADVQRYALTDEVPAGCTYGDFYFMMEARPSSPGAAYMVIDAAQLEQGTVATAFSQSADEALAAASVALTAANTAAADAAVAIASVNAMSNDNLLTSGEKSDAVLRYAAIINEQAGIDAQATTFGVTTEKSTYDSAVAALTSYLGTLSGWNVIPGSSVIISGSTWRANWNTVYTTRQALLNKIADEAGKRAAWAQVTGAGKPADNASADLVILTRGSCVATGNSVRKVGGASAFDSDAFSKNGIPGGSFVAAQVTNTDAVMFGLNSDPTTDQNYTSLDYAWYVAGATLQLFENGSSVATGFSYSIGDVLAIFYDGARVFYMQNNSLRRVVDAPADLTLFFDSSFSTPGARLDQIRFGPMSAVTDIATIQLQPNAATDIVQDTYDFAGAVAGSGLVTQRTVSYTPPVDCVIEFSASIVAANVLPDSGNFCYWTMAAGGGSDVPIAACDSNSGSRQTFAAITSLAAVGGVALVFKLITQRNIVNPQITLGASSIRVGAIKR